VAQKVSLNIIVSIYWPAREKKHFLSVSKNAYVVVQQSRFKISKVMQRRLIRVVCQLM